MDRNHDVLLLMFIEESSTIVLTLDAYQIHQEVL